MNRTPVLLTATVALLIAVPSHAAGATLTRAWQYKDASAAGLEVDNLIGDVRIEKGDSAGFHVSVRAVAEADTAAAAEALANAVEFQSRDAGGSSSFQVTFPDSHFSTIYLQDAPDSWWAGRMYAKYLGQRYRLTGDPDEGARIRVDIVVRVPEGGHLKVRSKFGNALAEGVTGDVTLDGTRGRVVSSNGNGRVVLDTGSGRAEVATHEGEVRADTGSGSITIANCKCRINADSGSGSVRISDSQGELVADTGSGSVTVRSFAGSVRADTGSGRVQIEGLSDAAELVVDTGAGAVRVAGDLSRLERFLIDTGSGSVAVEASAWPSMDIRLDTGSGGVTVDVPDAQVMHHDRRERTIRLGDGAGNGMIDTGSGSIRLRTVAAPAD